MKTLQISDEVYHKLMKFVVNPFDDTAEIVIDRLVEIATEAKEQHSRLEARQKDRGTYSGPERRSGENANSVPRRTRIPNIPVDESEVVL